MQKETRKMSDFLERVEKSKNCKLVRQSLTNSKFTNSK